MSERSVRDLLKRAERADGLRGRILAISGALLGSPYRVNPLTGSAYEPERFTAALDAFDCVTFVESVYAAAFARDEAGFLRQLRRLRYDAGTVSFARRNHYMTGWIANARRAGLFRRVTLPGEVTKRRRLDVVPGLPAVVRSFRCLPKRDVARAAARLSTGDLVCFASTRAHLDVFHCGILVKDETGLWLRHASRSRGGAVEQDLFDFLKANRTAGVLVARPVAGART